MKKHLILLCCLITSNSILSQNEVFIEAFIKDLYDKSKTEAHVAKTYLSDLKPNKRFSISLEKRKGCQLGHIVDIRKQDLSASAWFIPREKQIHNPKNHVEKYIKFKHLDTVSWTSAFKRKYQKQTYVLLNEDKSTILQYFLLDRNHKICAYTLFGKSGEVSFFIY